MTGGRETHDRPEEYVDLADYFDRYGGDALGDEDISEALEAAIRDAMAPNAGEEHGAK